MNKMDKTAKKPADHRTVTSKLGDKVERVGEKLKQMGADRLGNAIYKAGNKLEHSRDTKK